MHQKPMIYCGSHCIDPWHLKHLKDQNQLSTIYRTLHLRHSIVDKAQLLQTSILMRDVQHSKLDQSTKLQAYMSERERFNNLYMICQQHFNSCESRSDRHKTASFAVTFACFKLHNKISNIRENN